MHPADSPPPSDPLPGLGPVGRQPEPTPDLGPGGPDYAELHCLSSFSFQRGASQPEELVQRAHQLGYRALALTDECSVAGVVRAHTEARRLGLQLLPGAEFQMQTADGVFTLVVLPHNLEGWGHLCQCITAARSAAPKGQYRAHWDDALWERLQDCELLLAFLLPEQALAPPVPLAAARGVAREAARRWPGRVWLAISCGLTGSDRLHQRGLQQLAALTGLPLLATGQVQMHVRSRKPLHDALCAVRLGRPVRECGFALHANAEQHLRPRERLAALYRPEWLAATLEVASRCRFSLESLRYHYPREAVLPGLSPAETLREYVEQGALARYGGPNRDAAAVPERVRQQIDHELRIIAELHYEMYFLTVHDIVRFARSRDILCQGRGSAANSAVCYCLGITEVDPARANVLFERFISRARDEPPDIDVDFEHQRREEVIQYIYQKYGRDRAAITAVVACYRPRSALRDMGRALEIPEALITSLCKEHPGMYGREVLAERLQSALQQLPDDVPVPDAGRLARWLELARTLQRFPRHLGQHVGGFVLTDGPLTRLVPVENAAMKDRSVIQWEKDDLDAVGLLKVDVLALGMLSAIRRCLALVGQRRGVPLRMQDIPPEDSATYDMICAADTVGVFQIESRAQMSMLPRLRPRCFYDLVVEVAIVRPGPIQGGMVHPYLKARAQPEAVHYEFPELAGALQRTHGVPIFQEQVMQIAMAAADFSAEEADQLRRSMAAWKRKGGVHHFYDRLVGGMRKKGYSQEYADRLFKQIEGFGEYGFPESHAASFALLVYVSCWLKKHEPACFLAAMLNSQPLGFYGPAQLVQDARRHGVPVLAVDVSYSDWDCTLADAPGIHAQEPVRGGAGDAGGAGNVGGAVAVRLGLRLVHGLSQPQAERIAAERRRTPFATTEDLALRCQLDAHTLQLLASGDALHSLSGHRRQQVWEASALQAAPALLRGVPVNEAPLRLPAAHDAQEVVFDYAATGLSLRAHPVSFLRPRLAALRLQTAQALANLPHGRLARACGIVTMRQQPQTAKGVVFVTIEDETGSVNVIVWKSVKERQRSVLLRARLLAVQGVWQRDDSPSPGVCHLIAGRLTDLTPLLGELSTNSRDFH